MTLTKELSESFVHIAGQFNVNTIKEETLGVFWHLPVKIERSELKGGEFFIIKGHRITKIHQLHDYPVSMSEDILTTPPVSTICAMWPDHPGKVWVRKRFTEDEFNALSEELIETTAHSSSVFTLFNAVLGLITGRRIVPDYHDSLKELSKLAQNATEKEYNPYCLGITDDVLDANHLLRKLDIDKKNQVSSSNLALRFYHTLAQWVTYIALREDASVIIGMGCVFEDDFLCQTIQERLPHKVRFYAVPDFPFD
jgi:hydrogenase maturation factor HypF (carbamoyltransferase family)